MQTATEDDLARTFSTGMPSSCRQAEATHIPLLGWGTKTVLVPQLLGRSFQKARNFTF